jgi:ABC-type glycerol-3-phosphate transport system substrate-binding protein
VTDLKAEEITAMDQHPRPGRPGMSRRRFLTVAGAAVAGTALLSGCGSGAPAGTTLVREWNLFSGGDGERYMAIQAAFRERTPGTTLQSTVLPWGAPFYTKLAMGAAGGRGPDVATMHLSRLPGFSPTTLLDPFPADLLAEHGITPDKFLPEVWNRCVIDGQVYAVPLDTHMVVHYYNTDICAQAGLIGSDGKLLSPEGPDELVEQLRAIKGVTGTYGASIEAEQPWRFFASLYAQTGGEMLDPSGSRVLLDLDKATEVLEFLRRLSTDEKLLPGSSDYPATVALFGSGAAGMSFNGEWEVTTYLDAELPFGMAQMPNVYGSRHALGDCHTYVLPKRPDRDPETTRATVEYVSSMLASSLDWARGGHVPAYQPVATSAEYAALEPQSEYAAAADAVAFDPPGWFSGSGSTLQTVANDALGSVMTGAQRPPAAAAQLNAGLQRLVSIPSPV